MVDMGLLIDLTGLAFLLLVFFSLYIAIYTATGTPKESLWGYPWIITARNILLGLFILLGWYYALTKNWPLKPAVLGTLLLFLLAFKERVKIWIASHK